MTWPDITALSAAYDTDDIPTGANYDSIFQALLSLPHTLDYTTADVDHTNTTSESSPPFYTVTIPGGAMGSTGEARMLLSGDARGNTTGDCTLTTRVKFGGSTIATYAEDLINNATRSAYVLDLLLSNQGSTSAQLLTFGITTNGADGGGPITMRYVLPVTAAVDTTVDQTFAVTVQWATASTNNSVRRLHAKTTIAQN